MSYSHCFVRIRLKAQSRSEAYESIDQSQFEFIGYEEDELEETSPGVWEVDVYFSYPDSENVAEGDLMEDIGQEFRALLWSKQAFGAEYEFHIIAGGLHADPFKLAPNTIAMIAILGGSIHAHSSTLSAETNDESIATK